MLLFILVTVERVTQLCRDIFYRERKKKTQMVKKKKKFLVVVLLQTCVQQYCTHVWSGIHNYTRPDIPDLTVKPRGKVC